MSTGYEEGALYKGLAAPPNAGQGDLWVNQTTTELMVHNGLRFAPQVFPSGLAAPAGSLTGATLAAGVLASSLTSVGILTSLTVAGAVTMTAAASAVVPGATSFSVRNNADSADNLLVTNAGDATVRSSVAVGTTPATAGALRIANGASLIARNNANNANVVAVNVDSADRIVIGAAAALMVAGTGSGVGFQGTAPIAKPTVTGSRGANAALASLLTALASYGLVTDSSS